MRLHVDTDFAGDPDDACALAMVLGWPGVELVGVTTTADPDSRRAGYVKAFLGLLGISDVPVAAGAGRSMSGHPMGDIPDHDRFWGTSVSPPTPRKVEPSDAVDLIAGNLESGATLAAIGPYTNLALVHQAHPGSLTGMPVVTMGGWTHPFAAGYPAWGPARDWNVQCDPEAALTLFGSAADLTLVPCATAVSGVLRACDLPALRRTGRVGELLARQSLARADGAGYAALGRDHPALPEDLVNFHWDPVTCAVALGWSGATTEVRELVPVREHDGLRFEAQSGGRHTRVVTSIDGPALAETWLHAVQTAQTTVVEEGDGS